MRVLALPDFMRRAGKEGLSLDDPCDAVARAERGIIDAQIGKCLIKQRVARKGQGRSGGFRTILFYKHGNSAIFLHLFAKNAKSNLTSSEEKAYRDFAGLLAGLDTSGISRLKIERGWIEIDDDLP